MVPLVSIAHQLFDKIYKVAKPQYLLDLAPPMNMSQFPQGKVKAMTNIEDRSRGRLNLLAFHTYAADLEDCAATRGMPNRQRPLDFSARRGVVCGVKYSPSILLSSEIIPRDGLDDFQRHHLLINFPNHLHIIVQAAVK